MPWKESCVLDERLRFIADWEREEWTMSALCRRYGVSRPTGYKWVRRYADFGLDGLKELGRAPWGHPNATPEAIEGLIVEARMRHPTWGARKLLAWLLARDASLALPSASTAGEILRRRGLVRGRRRRRRTPAYTEPFVGCAAPNRTWCADFKGWFRSRDGARIDPLTVSDAHSRYLLVCRAVERADHEHVRPVFERCFREYGLPEAVRTDNGPPFASVSAGGLSRLSVWWVKLGIVPERIAPGKPEQNGRHERMHRTLKAETASPARSSRRSQQRAFDAFREEYNTERPHEALGMRPPARVYRRSVRSYPSRLREPEYAEGVEVRRVRSNGEIKWRGEKHFLSEVLVGEPVGLRREDDRCWTVMFGPVRLALWDEATRSLLR